MLGPKYDIKNYLCFDVKSVIAKTFHYAKIHGKPITMEMINEIDDVDRWLEEKRNSIVYKPGRCIMFDEAGVGAYVREFWSKDNKILAKLLQLWRFLRVIVVIVVPVDMSLAESTINRFLNIEIMMVSVNRSKGFAKCVAYEHIGWIKKKKESIRRRVTGCKHGGFIRIKALTREQAEEYIDAMFLSKFGAMLRLAKEYKIFDEMKIGKTKSIWDDVKYVKEHFDEFKSEAKQGGILNTNKIRIKLGVSVQKARDIKAITEEQLAKEKTITGGNI